LGEDSESVSASRIGGVIPFFFYDAIARMIPGAFLLAGILITLKGGLLSVCWPSVIQSVFPKDSGAGYSTVVFLGLLATVHFLGSTLGSLSHTLVERSWSFFCPLTMKKLGDYVGTNDTSELSSRFKRRFGGQLRDDNLNELSFLCTYHVWAVDQNLGAMTGRIDAECLGAQSCVLVAICLALSAWLKTGDRIWAVSISLIALGMALGFHYLRKRRLFGRFAMFIATSAEAETPGPVAPPDAEPAKANKAH
jgi:hypothetical protein